MLVLACDGVWDVMSSQEVATFLLDELHKAGSTRPEAADLSAAAERLLDRCLTLGSRDNMSVVVTVFDGSASTVSGTATTGVPAGGAGAAPPAAGSGGGAS